jgi:hypothetical protein
VLDNVSKIDFLNFPHDFSETSNFFLDIFQRITSQDPECADILSREHLLISNCYTQQKLYKKLVHRIQAEFSSPKMTKWLELQYGLDIPKKKYAKRLWITYENRRPHSQYFQRTLSFDLDDFSGLNHYLPLWVLYIDFLENDAEWNRHRIRQNFLLDSRILPIEDRKKKFVCAFINNPDPVRLRALEELSRLGPVDIYGRYSKNYVKDKIEVSRHYRFSICFENDLYPGYVTEKPLEAWLGDTVPLYWGDDSNAYLNPKALINLQTFASLKDFINYVHYVQSNDEVYKEIYQQPFLQRPYDENALIAFLKEWIRE